MGKVCTSCADMADMKDGQCPCCKGMGGGKGMTCQPKTN
jgi:hypothetical protein